jgi:protein ImuB
VLPEPVPARVLDAAGRPVVVGVRLATSGDPAVVEVPDAGAAAVEALVGRHAVTGWAGPWPVAERWWTPGGKRRVFLQVVTDLPGDVGLLLSASSGTWVLEAVYD